MCRPHVVPLSGWEQQGTGGAPLLAAHSHRAGLPPQARSWWSRQWARGHQREPLPTRLTGRGRAGRALSSILPKRRKSIFKVYSRIVRSIYQMKKSVDGVSVEFTDNLKAFSQPVAYRCCAMGHTLVYFGEGRGVAPHGWAVPGDQMGC